MRIRMAGLLGVLFLAACHKSEPGQMLSTQEVATPAQDPTPATPPTQPTPPTPPVTPPPPVQLPQPIVTDWPLPLPALKAGSVLFVVGFTGSADQMIIAVSDPAQISLARQNLKSGQVGIVMGLLVPGDGGFNSNGTTGKHWSWHLDPNSVQFPGLSTEVCDGLPSFVEQDLTYWLQLGRFCPWSAHLVREL